METAILLCVPEAEPLVHEWRLKGDPSAARGVPAHVTLLYPFLPRAAVDAGVLGELAWFFRGVDALPLEFRAVRHFPASGMVWMEPAGDTVGQLTRALARRWPECPPYAGTIPVDELLPHLTIVQSDDRDLRRAAADAVSPGLPLRVLVREASLWAQDETGDWAVHTSFAFGPPE